MNMKMTVLKKVYGKSMTSLQGIIVEKDHKQYYVPKEQIKDMQFENARVGSNGKLYFSKMKCESPAFSNYVSYAEVAKGINAGTVSTFGGGV